MFEFMYRLKFMTLRQVAIIMLLVTLVAPMISMAGGYTRTGEETIVHISIVALTWIFLPPYWDNNRGSMGAMGGGFHVLEPFVLVNTSILLIFNIIFAVQVIRFCKGDASKRSTLISGFLTLVLPLLMALQAYSWFLIQYMVETNSFVYVGPIPIQLIIGLIFIRYAGPWEVQGPWKDDKSEQDKWWQKNDEAQDKIEFLNE